MKTSDKYLAMYGAFSMAVGLAAGALFMRYTPEPWPVAPPVVPDPGDILRQPYAPWSVLEQIATNGARENAIAVISDQYATLDDAHQAAARGVFEDLLRYEPNVRLRWTVFACVKENALHETPPFPELIAKLQADREAIK